MILKNKVILVVFYLFMLSLFNLRGQSRIYLALDDHTDYYWRATGPTYDSAFVEMIDYYLDLADKIMDNEPYFQSRFNCDGSYWMYVYEKLKSKEEFE